MKSTTHYHAMAGLHGYMPNLNEVCDTITYECQECGCQHEDRESAYACCQPCEDEFCEEDDEEDR